MATATGGSSPGVSMAERTRRALARGAGALALREQGLTFAEIGARLGVGEQRARMIVRAAEKMRATVATATGDDG